MHGNVPTPAASATKAAARGVSKSPDTAPKSADKIGAEIAGVGAKIGTTVRCFTDTNGSDWFPSACRTILGKDAGGQLRIITGCPERNCYRYASGESPPPAEFLRKLIFSPQGAPFFTAFMHACTAPWWLDHQRKLRNADKVDGARFE